MSTTTRPGTTPPDKTLAISAAPDDCDLVAAYVGGDETAFDRLVERHQQYVYGLCYRYFRDHQDAEDATQETFLALARQAGRFRGDARLTTWLHRVAINVCHDTARVRGRRPQPSQQQTPDLAEPIDLVASREAEIDLHSALAQLDAPSRRAIVLVAIEDRSYAEAAQIAGISVSALKSRIHRARARLTDIIEMAA